jgi:serine/threonine protein kinase/Tol biopolymer transport system component
MRTVYFRGDLLSSDPLIEIALHIADGTPVEWEEVHRRVSPADRPVVGRLHQLEELSAIHASTSEPPCQDAQGPTRWGFLEILEKIGRGSYGDVYRAHDPRLGRDVALKLLRQGDDDGESTLIREGHLLARVHHPNVVTVYGAERIDGRTGVWMELVRGETLEAQLLRGQAFSAKDVQSIGIDLCRAIQAVHAAGLLHRDIKAQNVTRAEDGRLVLMDFGTGVEGRETRPRLAGTPAYLAPEVLFGGAPSKASEVYSLGVLLFHLATGKFPVEGTNLSSLEHAHRQTGPVSLALVRQDFPRALCTAIDRALAPEPQSRFPDVRELEHALISGLPRHLGRSKLTIAAAALGGAILTATVLFNVGSRDRPVSKSVTLSQVSPTLQQRANIRAPGWVGTRATCSPAPPGGAVALCDIIDGTIRVLRAPASNRERSPQAFLSPNGDLVAYIWFVEPSTESVRVIRADGSQDRELLGPDAGVAVLQGWTPTSERLLLTRSTSDGFCRELVDVSTGAQERLQCAATPMLLGPASLSPDGRYLAYLKTGQPGGSTEVRILDRTTGSDHAISTDDSIKRGPVWTPDGTAIAIVSNRLGTWGLYTVAIENGVPRGALELVRELGRSGASPLGFTREGVLYLQMLTDLEDVLHVQIDAAARALVNIGRAEGTAVDESVRSPAWSPDGQQFALIVGAWRGVARIVIARAGGGVVRTFTPERPSRLDAVRWSPDGDMLATIVNGTGSTPPIAIDLVSVPNRTQRRLFESNDRISDIRWAPDSRGVYYKSRGAISLVDMAGASHEVYRPESPYSLEAFSTFDVSGDGSLVVAVRVREAPCVARIVTAGGSVRDLGAFKNNCRSIAWGPGERSVLAGVHDGNTSIPLFEVPLDGSPPVRFASPRIQVVDIAVNPVSGELLLGSGNPHPDVWMLSGFAAAVR